MTFNDVDQVSSVGDTSASGGSSYHSEETECLLDVDRTHYLRLSNRIKEKLKRRCSFQVYYEFRDTIQIGKIFILLVFFLVVFDFFRVFQWFPLPAI